MSDAILVLNAGSSSIKVALFDLGSGGEPALLCRGLLDEHGEPRLVIKDGAGAVLFDRHRTSTGGEDGLFGDVLSWVDGYLASDELVAVGHRIVHGGSQFVHPVPLTGEVIDALHALTPLAPLHQERCLTPARTVSTLRPELPQIACFDTAFHHDLPPLARHFAIPRRFEAQGIRRYGFHGLSYEFIARSLAQLSPELAGRRTVVAHLGSGASLCAMRDGVSIDKTMGLTPLDGLMMGTRCGAIDPGVLLYLQKEGMSADEMTHLLYEQSGLLGVSGLSSDMRALLSSDDPRAADAVDLFAFSVAREVAAMANSLGGLECLVFTGGIGEHRSEIRERVCIRLGWLGIDLKSAANKSGCGLISTDDSKIDVRVIPTDEEGMIARHCAQLFASSEP
jgi:acetate kinase